MFTTKTFLKSKFSGAGGLFLKTTLKMVCAQKWMAYKTQLEWVIPAI
jgi:hypothetical protein